MEVIVWILVVLLILGVMSSMVKRRRLINDLHSIRINALKSPQRYTQGFDIYDDPNQVRLSIASTLTLALVSLGHNVGDYIPGNIEATIAFNETVNEIYELWKKQAYNDHDDDY